MVIDEYSNVFQTREKHQSPHRKQDHVILLKPDSQISSNRPYKYPHYQKTD